MPRLLAILAILALGACASPVHPPLPGPTLQDVRVEARERLTWLEAGMSRGQVLAAMGTETVQTYRHGRPRRSPLTGRLRYRVLEDRPVVHPYRAESRRGADGAQVEVLYYYTDRRRGDGVISRDELTPLVLVDGELVGWGWPFLERR